MVRLDDLYLAWIIAAVFELRETEVWISANNLTIIAPQARVRTIGDQSELILPVKLNLNARTQIEAKYTW